jgi:hypothetical protein
LVGVGEVLWLLRDPEVDGVGDRDLDERVGGDDEWLTEDPAGLGDSWPTVLWRPWPACERGLPNTLSGVSGPPNRLRPTRTRAPTSRRLPATPAAFMNLLR